MGKILPTMSIRHLDIIFRPERFIKTRPANSGIFGRRNRIREVGTLSAFYILNLLLFALPLYGQFTHQWFPGNQVNSTLWMVLMVVLFSGITYWMYYFGLWITGNNPNTLHTFQTVIYCTAIYLAAMLSIIALDSMSIRTFLSFSSGHPIGQMIADPFLYIYLGYETIPSSSLELLMGSGDSSLISTFGRHILLYAFLLSFIYYIYSIYVSARVRHGTSRFEAAIVGVLVLSSFRIALLSFNLWNGDTVFKGLPPNSGGFLAIILATSLVLLFGYRVGLKRYEA